jgi:hypothetical protein
MRFAADEHGCADANRDDRERGLETQLENEIANMSNSVDELTERHLDTKTIFE